MFVLLPIGEKTKLKLQEIVVVILHKSVLRFQLF